MNVSVNLEHLGQINVVSSPGQGAYFMIELPVQQVGFR